VEQNRRVRARAVGASFIVASFVSATVSIVALTKCMSLKDALRAGRVSVLEGTVVDFRPVLPPSRGDESFRVGNRVFRYSEHDIDSGFNITFASGGPIRDGLSVRISYVGDRILRLEIQR